jgi:RNA polymerase sporulation-specific sigma factor
LFPGFLNFLFLIKPFSLVFSYITNANTFPQPLSSDEEKELLEDFKKGSMEARNKLIEHNLRLVAHIVKKFNNSSQEQDDLISIGTIGLIKAISTYDIARRTRLATYAARCIENEILMNLRSTKKVKAEVSLQEPIGVDKEGNEISLIDILGTENDTVSEEVEFKLQKKTLYDVMKSILAKREKKVIELRYGLSNHGIKTQREIAKVLGISRSYVSRIEKRAIKKLFKEIKTTNCR